MSPLDLIAEPEALELNLALLVREGSSFGLGKLGIGGFSYLSNKVRGPMLNSSITSSFLTNGKSKVGSGGFGDHPGDGDC
jgi:hypothetical protein